MNTPLALLIAALGRALRDDVRPELASDHARSQLAGVLDVLAKLESMTTWSVDARLERLAALQDGAAAFDAAAARHGVGAASTPPPASRRPEGSAALDAALRDAEDRVDRCIDRFFAARDRLPAAPRAELDRLLRDALRTSLVAERKLVRRADFESMTAGAARAAP